MDTIRAAIIGCGKPPREKGATGHGMAHPHVQGYQVAHNCEVVACADIVEGNAKAFAQQYGIPATYTDYREMIKKEKVDIVSICTWPDSHEELVVGSAKAGVKAIHCEKPMAAALGPARRMKEFCEQAGVQLTFNHQRRFEKPYQLARKLCNQGVIGDLMRIEVGCGNLFDWGTHWFDMMNFYNNDVAAEWVIGQIDSRTESAIFGVQMENMGIANIRFVNGVYGLMISGAGQTIWADHRLLGTDGTIEVKDFAVHVRGKGDKATRVITFPDEPHIGAWSAITFAIWDALHGLVTGREPELSARKAYAATEFIFATYESSRRRARIDLPLDIDDNPLHSMMEAGLVGPNRKA